MAVQFFLFGLLVVWFTGTGKLRAFFDALRSTPPADSSGGEQSVQTPEGVGIVGPNGEVIVVPGAGGNPQIAPGVG